MTRALAMVLVAGACAAAPAANPLPLPAIVVWAWDRDEDLRALPAEVGVASLEATAYLVGERVDWRPRVKALQLAATTRRIPVVRIEPVSPSLSVAQRDALVERLVTVARAQGALQLDYEAPLSQRAFYRQLLTALRARLGPGVPLSITALASWCLGDRWMGGLPVDEIVPMYYRLGPAAHDLRAQLAAGVDVAPECRRAHGLITDEPLAPPPSPRRLYIFSPVAWRPATVERAVARLAIHVDKD